MSPHRSRVPGALKRRLYAGQRPGRIMRVWNRIDAALYRRGPFQAAATLEVRGRRSGRRIMIPVAVAEHADREYLVSMLGPDAAWVANVRAAGGRAVLHRDGRALPICLEEVAVASRGPILEAYAATAPGARPHLHAQPGDPPERFEQIAPHHPAFLIRSALES